MTERLTRSLSFLVYLQCVLVSVVSEVNLLYIYIPSFFGFPSHLGHHRALSRVPCAI